MTPVEAMRTSSGSAPDRVSDTGDDLVGVGEALWAGRDVRVLRDDDERAKLPSETFQRLSRTLGPEKRLFVKTAAAVHGRSAAITTKSSESSLMPTFAT